MAGPLGEFEQLVMLAVLALKDEAYGVAIRREIVDRTGRDVAAGAIYTTLSRLETRGLVSSRVGETAPERSGQRRRYYSVSTEGAAALHEALATVQRMSAGLMPELQRMVEKAR